MSTLQRSTTTENRQYCQPRGTYRDSHGQGTDCLDQRLEHLHTESVRSSPYQVKREDKSCSRLINYVIRSCDGGDKTGLSESGISIFFITTSSLNQCVAGLKVPGELFRK